MPTTRSFTEYVQNTFYNALFAAAQDYVVDHPGSLDPGHRHVRRAGIPEVCDISVEHVWCHNKPGMRIGFDVAFSVEFCVQERDYHYDDCDECCDWLLAECEGDLEKKLSDFVIKDVRIYDGKARKRDPLDDALVPVMKREELDSYAERFLEKYCPKAIENPGYLDPLELAASMGLTVKQTHIRKDGSVFGQTCFKDCEAELYDPDTDSCYKEQIPAGTILVDPDVVFEYNLGAFNNTVVHECVHWAFHRKAFLLESLFSNSASSIRCKVVGGAAGEKKDSRDWMEWQANALAPRIQMPLPAFKRQIAVDIAALKKTDDYDFIDIIEPLIDQLALDFGVSRTAAKIRMLDAGFSEAAGAFIYVDGRYIPPHRARAGFLERNQTFSISLRDAAIAGAVNPALREMFDQGIFRYVDAHFVLDSPDYIERDEDGNLTLTHFARNHMDRCCLVFDLSIKSERNNLYHSECFLNRDKNSDIKFQADFPKEVKGAEDRAAVLKAHNKDMLSVKMDGTFSGTLDALLNWSGRKREEIAWDAGYDTKTIWRYKSDENITEEIKTETIFRLCIGMQLPIFLSMRLFDAAHKGLRSTERDIMFLHLLMQCPGIDFDECNKQLLAVGLKPMVRETREKKK